LDCPLLGYSLNSNIILHFAEEENKKGASLIFKLWPYESIQQDIKEVSSLLSLKIGSKKILENAILSSPLFGSYIPQMFRRKTLKEISQNWNISLTATLTRINNLFPENHFSVLIPYHLDENWWNSSFTYLGLNSNFAAVDGMDGPNIFSGANYFLENHLTNMPADKWPQALAKITSQPALIAGLPNRGFLQKDYFADIVIFNPDKLKGFEDYQNPSHEGEGIETVIMNGQIVWQKGRVWKRKVGKLLI